MRFFDPVNLHLKVLLVFLFLGSSVGVSQNKPDDRLSGMEKKTGEAKAKFNREIAALEKKSGAQESFRHSPAHLGYGIQMPVLDSLHFISYKKIQVKISTLQGLLVKAQKDPALLDKPAMQIYFIHQALAMSYCFWKKNNGTLTRVTLADPSFIRERLVALNTLDPGLAYTWQRFYSGIREIPLTIISGTWLEEDNFFTPFDDDDQNFFYESGAGYYYSTYAENFEDSTVDGTDEYYEVTKGVPGIIGRLKKFLTDYPEQNFPEQFETEKKIKLLLGELTHYPVKNETTFYDVLALARILKENHYPGAVETCLKLLLPFRAEHKSTSYLAGHYRNLDELICEYALEYNKPEWLKFVSAEFPELKEELNPDAGTGISYFNQQFPWLSDSLFFKKSGYKKTDPEIEVKKLQWTDEELEHSKHLHSLVDYLTAKMNIADVYTANGKYREAGKVLMREKEILEAYLKIREFDRGGPISEFSLKNFSKQSSFKFGRYTDFRNFVSLWYPEKTAGNVSALFASDSLGAKIYKSGKNTQYWSYGLERYEYPVALSDTAINLQNFVHSFSSYSDTVPAYPLIFDGYSFGRIALEGLAKKAGSFPFARDLSIAEINDAIFQLINRLNEAGMEFESQWLCGYLMRNMDFLSRGSYASTMVEFSSFLDDNGFGEWADSLHLHCYRIYETRGDTVSDYFARLCSFIGINHPEPGFSLSCAKKANRIYRLQGIESENFTRSCGIVAADFMEMNRMDSAQGYFHHILNHYHTVKKDTISEDYANAMLPVARYYREINKQDSAVFYFEKIMRIKKKSGDTLQHMDIFLELAAIYEKQGNFLPASQLMLSVYSSIVFNLEKRFPFMSDMEKIRFFSLMRSNLDDVIAFYFRHRAAYPGFSRMIFDFDARFKGISLRASADLRDEIVKTADAELKKAYADFLDRKQEAEAEGKQDLLVQTRLFSEERYLLTLAKSGSKNAKATGFDQVQHALEENEALINILSYKDETSGETKYAGQVIRKGEPMPLVVELGNAGKLEKKAYPLYMDEIETVQAGAGTEYAWNYFFQALEKNLKGIKKIYFTADGIYTKINLYALFDPVEKKYLLDKYDIIYLSGPAVLVPFKEAKPDTFYRNVFLSGDIKFNTCVLKHKHEVKIDSLPGTKAELDDIYYRIVSAGNGNPVTISKLTGEIANEKNMRWNLGQRKDSFQLVHIATHGFYVPDKQDLAGLDPAFIDSVAKFRSLRNISFNFLNPFSRSGILLAGSENTFNGEDNKVDEDDIRAETDGIFSAYEIMDMNLKGVNLVVLSACETGLGKIVSGDGVNGMEKALKIAGARKVMLSLWPVDDAGTRDLMYSFYSSLFGRKSKTRFDILVSLKESMIKMKKKYGSPVFWAPFVVVN